MKGKNLNLAPVSGSGLVHFFLFWAEVFLAVRFILHFFAVDPSGGFGAWIFNSTQGLVEPFRGVFANGNMVAGHPHYVDLQLLFIMASYAVVAAVLVAVMRWVSPRKK